MRRLIPAAFFLIAVSNSAYAQQPQSAAPPIANPAPAPAAIAATPLPPSPGATVIKGSGGCSNCGTGSTIRGAFQMSTGGNCTLGSGCQNGCGSLKSDLAFQFGSCKNFFNSCGPTWAGPFGGKCGYLPFAKPYGTGWSCPKQYDSYLNH